MTQMCADILYADIKLIGKLLIVHDVLLCITRKGLPSVSSNATPAGKHAVAGKNLH